MAYFVQNFSLIIFPKFILIQIEPLTQKLAKPVEKSSEYPFSLAHCSSTRDYFFLKLVANERSDRELFFQSEF